MRLAYLIEPPFNYRTRLGQVTGCDVELARQVFSTLGIKDFELVEAEFAELLPGIVQGHWQMTTGLFATQERMQSASFSRPIWALPDGLLVRRRNPLELTGYRSIAQRRKCRLGVVRGQIQHQSAMEFGVPSHRIGIFENYNDAAEAVLNGTVDAYASVARAHIGFMALNSDLELEGIAIPSKEKPPAFGAFAFARDDQTLRPSVDHALSIFLGSRDHRVMMAGFGFTDAEVDLVAKAGT